MHQLKDPRAVSDIFKARDRALGPPRGTEQGDLCGLSTLTLQHPPAPQCLAQAPFSVVLEVINPLTEFSQDPSLISASHPRLSNKNKAWAGIQALGSAERGCRDLATIRHVFPFPDAETRSPKLPDANGMHLGLV